VPKKKTSPAQRLCAAYVRVSHAKQTRSYHEKRGRSDVGEAEMEGGVSYEAQQEALGRWVAEHDLQIAPVTSSPRSCPPRIPVTGPSPTAG
jgi:hypothetical protein